MKLAGDYHFDASVVDVWGALFDPTVLAAALPGCEKLERQGDGFTGEMKIKIGPVSGSFAGKVDLADIDEPRRYRMVIDGRGPSGFVKATATVELAEDGGGTRLHYEGDAQVGGKIASVGERLIDASSRAIVKQALENLHENVKIRAAAQPEVVPEFKQAQASDFAAGVAKEVGKSLWPYLVAGGVGIAVIVWLVLR
jgi:carbon monoxide dehydrogenase subunit G